MTPRVLFVGGEKGSWDMRGRQMAAQLGARHTAKKMAADDWAWPDVVILVKRAAEQWAADIRKHCRARLIWDVLDVWAQPDGNQRTEADLVTEVTTVQQCLGISTLIGATQAMATAIGGVYIPHHHRLGLHPTAPRPTVRVVAYEGSPRYLGRWKPALERACAERGLKFVINPDDIRQADLLVAFRDGAWDGWACRQWKSGIKYVNAIAAGRPILTQPCAALNEIEPSSSAFEDPEIVGTVIDHLSHPAYREDAFEEGLRRVKAFDITSIGAMYQRVIRDVMKRAA